MYLKALVWQGVWHGLDSALHILLGLEEISCLKTCFYQWEEEVKLKTKTKSEGFCFEMICRYTYISEKEFSECSFFPARLLHALVSEVLAWDNVYLHYTSCVIACTEDKAQFLNVIQSQHGV